MLYFVFFQLLLWVYRKDNDSSREKPHQHV